MDAWVTPIGVSLREHPALVWAGTRATLPRARSQTTPSLDLGPHGPTLSWDRPPRISSANRPFRWAIFLWQISDPHTNQLLRRRFAEWTCRDWNAQHPPERALRAFEIHFQVEETLPPGEGVRRAPRLLLRYDCVAGVQSWGAADCAPADGGPPTRRVSPGA